jgi:hypothetical protein
MPATQCEYATLRPQPNATAAFSLLVAPSFDFARFLLASRLWMYVIFLSVCVCLCMCVFLCLCARKEPSRNLYLLCNRQSTCAAASDWNSNMVLMDDREINRMSHVCERGSCVFTSARARWHARTASISALLTSLHRVLRELLRQQT